MSKFTKSFMVISALVTVSLITWKLAFDHSNKPTSTDVASNILLDSKSEEFIHIGEDEESEPESTSQDPKGYARRIVHVPGSVDGEPLDSNTENTNPENIDSMAQRNLEAALDGDLDAGYYVQWALRNCQAIPLDTALLEKIIQSYSEHADQMEKEGTPIPPEGSHGGRDDLSVGYPTEAQNREHLNMIIIF